MMNIEETNFDGLLCIHHKLYRDARGVLRKVLDAELASRINMRVDDAYLTASHARAVRGLHHQRGEFGQTKLISCIQGSFLDIAVDLRPASRTYGQTFVYTLDAEKATSVLVPAGFSHGTLSLQDQSIAHTLCSGEYYPEYEEGIHIASVLPDINPLDLILSEKDKGLPTLHEYLNK
jgi:dTDP-4-dehydrorhamnose 3,5-epimerase